MSTGTLLSLNAVVMKQPKVKAAMTLREKANKEFALDRTVFIFKLQLRHRNGEITDGLTAGTGLYAVASYWVKREESSFVEIQCISGKSLSK